MRPAEHARTPMIPFETTLQQADLELVGSRVNLSALGPHWLHDSPLLEDARRTRPTFWAPAMLRGAPGPARCWWRKAMSATG